MEITLKDISQRIKDITDERGYTPYALAEKVPQVVQSTVYNALSGEKSMKVETLMYICDALISDCPTFSRFLLIYYHNPSKLQQKTAEKINRQLILSLLPFLCLWAERKILCQRPIIQ